jgi:hypothetical protein
VDRLDNEVPGKGVFGNFNSPQVGASAIY